jgi:hypothetical protein
VGVVVVGWVRWCIAVETYHWKSIHTLTPGRPEVSLRRGPRKGPSKERYDNKNMNYRA